MPVTNFPNGLSSFGKTLDHEFSVVANIPAGAAAADFDGLMFTNTTGYSLVLRAVTERHAVAGNDAGAVTLMVKKVPSGTAKAAGTDMLSAGLDLKATANTNQSGSLHATTANITLANGDSIGLVPTGTLTTLDGVTVTCRLRLDLSAVTD